MSADRTFAPGDRVRVLTGFLGGGDRVHVVAGVRNTIEGVIVDVDVTAPSFIFDPSSPLKTTRLPYAPHELEADA